jgi:hypothetical protein
MKGYKLRKPEERKKVDPYRHIPKEKYKLEQDLCSLIGDEVCTICKKNPSTTGSIAKHRHPGVVAKRVNIDFSNKTDGEDNYNFDEKEWDVYYFYVCTTCIGVLQEDVTYRYCVICSNLYKCPQCKEFNYELVKNGGKEGSRILCESCDKRAGNGYFCPDQISVDNLEQFLYLTRVE